MANSPEDAAPTASVGEPDLRLFVENAPAGIAMLDRETRYMAVSARYAEIFRLRAADLVGHRHTEVLPALPERWGKVWRRCLGGAIERAKEDPLPRADGSVDYVDWEIRPWRDAALGVGGIILGADIVTERRLGSEAVAKSEERFRALFERAPVGMAELAGDDAKVVRANARLAAILGVPAGELRGRPLAELVAPSAREAILEDLIAVRSRRTSRVEREVQLPLPRPRMAVVAVAALENDDSIVVTFEDVTNRHRLVDPTPPHPAPAPSPPVVASGASGPMLAPEAVEHREREQAVLAAFENAPIGLAFVIPGENRFSTVNARLCEMLGYTKDELLSAGVIETTHPDDRAFSARQLKRMATGEDTEVSFVKRCLRKNGSTVLCDLRVAAIPRKPGEPLQTVVGFTDLSERQQAERWAQEAERRWGATAEAAREAIILTSADDDRIVDVNGACERLTGFSRAELKLRTASELGLSMPARTRATSAAAASGDVLLRRKDGQLRRCDVSTASLTLDGRDAWVSVVTDISGRRAAEDALRASEERYHDVVERLEEPIISTDVAGVITYANHAVSCFGYTPAELVGTSAKLLLRPEDRAEARAWLRGFAHEQAGPRERFILDKSGKARPVRHTPGPIVRDGKVVGFTTIMTDLTAQRAVEEQLRASQRMEAVGRLAGGVAHDFNNLLTVILTYAEIASSEIPDQSPTQECLSEVVQAGKRAEGLTRQLLAFSRKQLIALEPVSVEKVVGGVASMLRRLIGEDVHLEIDAASDVPLVEAEVGQLELVLMNLAINSRDAMPDGGVIAVGIRKTALEADAANALDVRPGPYVELSVRDSGTGMDEETRLRVFEPFFTTKAVGKGTGLGLSTVYGIVKQFGGAIGIESKVGAGTTFRIYLPPAVIAEAAPVKSPARGTLRPPPRGSEQILVVEDDAAMRRVLRRILSSAGYRVTLCAAPSEAFEVCRTPGSDVDLVLTDVVMPEMNGRELSRRVQALKPNLPVVYMSGYTDEALERLDVLHGNFLRKPFTSEALQRVVRSALDQSGGDPVSGAALVPPPVEPRGGHDDHLGANLAGIRNPCAVIAG